MPVGVHIAKANHDVPVYNRDRVRAERWLAICDGTLALHRVQVDSDGKVRIFLDVDDADVPNWLDPVENPCGLRRYIDTLREAGFP
jgi:hypothetical protein